MADSATVAPRAVQAQPSAKIDKPQSAQLSTQNSTISIQLVPAPIVPAPPLPFYLNSAIVVPLVTLLGVALTVWFGWWKTHRELKASDHKWKVDRQDALKKTQEDRTHSAEEARKARLVVARRDIYLELVKEMTAASMALGGMAFKKGEDFDVQEGFKGFLSAAARVAILGEMNTVVRSRELMNLVQKVLYKKLPEIIEMRVVKSGQERLEQLERQQLEKSEGLKALLSDLLKNSVGTGATGATSITSTATAWTRALDQSDADARMFGERAAECSSEYLALAQKYQLSILEDTTEIAQKTNELIVEIRAELELANDLILLQTSTAEMYATAKESIKKMQESVSN